MPANITDVSVFTAPATRPAGSDVRDSASVQGPFQALANRTRYNKDRFDLLAAETASPRVFGIGCFHPENPAQWDTTFGGAGGGHLAAPTVNNALGRFECEGLPRGATVVQVDVMMGTSVSRSAADRWQASLYHVNRDFPGLASGATQLSTTINDLGGATGIELMGWAGLTQLIGVGSALVVQIEAPNGSLAIGDYLYGVRVTFTRAF